MNNFLKSLSRWGGTLLMLFTITFLSVSCDDPISQNDTASARIEVNDPGTNSVIVEFNMVAGYKPFTVTSNDGGIFTIAPIVTFNVAPNRTGNPPDLGELQTTIYKEVTSAYKQEFNKYSADWIVNNIRQLENDVTSTLLVSLSQKGFKLNRLTNVVDPPSGMPGSELSPTTAK